MARSIVNLYMEYDYPPFIDEKGISIGDLKPPKNPPNARRVTPTQYGPSKRRHRRGMRKFDSGVFGDGLCGLSTISQPIS